MARKKRTRSVPVIGALAAAFLPATALLPLRLNRALGGMAGRAAGLSPGKSRDVSQLNVALCRPDLSPSEQRRLVRQSLSHTAMAALELGPLWCWSHNRLAALEDQVIGDDLLDAAGHNASGTLLLLPHLGNWEFFNQFLIQRGPFTALYRSARIDQIDRLIRTARERSGCTMAPATAGGVRQLLMTLRQGGTVVILPDQEPIAAAGVFSPFFAIPALTMSLVSKLAQRCQPATFFGTALRTATGFQIHIETAPEALFDADLATSVAALNLGVESLVRSHPEQYLWSYKRFKTRPEGELTPYRSRSFSQANRHLLDPLILERLGR